jgi:hypothetical protein
MWGNDSQLGRGARPSPLLFGAGVPAAPGAGWPPPPPPITLAQPPLPYPPPPPPVTLAQRRASGGVQLVTPMRDQTAAQPPQQPAPTPKVRAPSLHAFQIFSVTLLHRSTTAGLLYGPQTPLTPLSA